jgi:hypothetical protein
MLCPQSLLRYIKRSNEETGPAGIAQLRAAYAFSLETVGQDMAAGPLWQEYINFLQQPKPGTAQFAALFPNALEGQEEAARTPLVRYGIDVVTGIGIGIGIGVSGGVIIVTGIGSDIGADNGIVTGIGMDATH